MADGCIKSIYVDMWHRRVCGKPVKTVDGQYCGVHDPAREQKRREEKQTKWDAERSANERLRKATDGLIARLGMGTKEYCKGWTGNVILTAGEVEEVLSWKAEERREPDCIDEYKRHAEADGSR